EHVGKGTRLCTELVASAYYEVDEHRFGLKIRSRAGEGASANVKVQASGPATMRGAMVIRHGLAPAVDDGQFKEDAVAASQSCIELFMQNSLPAGPRVRKLFGGYIALDAATNTPIGVVTPRDLEFSPSLRYVGRLEA